LPDAVQAPARGYPAHLIAIRDARDYLPAITIPGVAEKISASNVMVDADFSAAEPGEVSAGGVKQNRSA